MSFAAWTLFAGFWVIFVTSPGPNAVNCIQNGMNFGFGRALIGVAAILTQATAFLLLSAAGVTALLTASPTAFLIAKLIGAGFLIWLGIRGWMRAATPLKTSHKPARHIYLHALSVATINPKSVAGYLAAFSQFVQPDVAMAQQMVMIMPTALTITALSYTGYTALGAALGRAALSAIGNLVLRRVLAGSFVLYGLALGATALPQGNPT